MAITDTFRIDLPDNWHEVPIEPDDFRRHVLGIFDEAEWRSVPPVERRRVELFVERVVADLRRADARFASVLLENVAESEAGAGDGGLVVAGVTVAIMSREQLGSEVPLTAEVMHMAMSSTDDRPKDETQSRTRTTNIEPPAIIELPVGRVVRLVRLMERGGPKDVSRFFTETYLVPMPDDFERLLMVQFATPQVEDARPYSDLFAAVARTLHCYRVGEPTTL